MLLPVGAINQSFLTPCPACQSPLQVEVFPALFRKDAPGETGALAVMDDEATCFYHANKQAVLPCHGCGRFLCALCDCELNGEHFCPVCLEKGRTSRKIKTLENKRTLYDSIALTLALAPLIIFYFTLITAPMSLYIAIRHWNAPRSIVHSTRSRYILAVIISSLEIIGWIAVFLYLYSLFASRRG
jgi:hypothetical protein